MSVTQKGLFVVQGRSNYTCPETEFSVTCEFIKHPNSIDFNYVYLTQESNGTTAFKKTYSNGYLGLIRKITITPSENNQKNTYTFELSKLVRPVNKYFMEISKKPGIEHGAIFEWDFESAFAKAAENKPGDCEFDEGVLLNPFEPHELPLTIKKAMPRLAKTYGVEPESITISVTGK